MNKIVVGTRGSNLAITQSNLFIKQIKEIAPKLKIEMKVIKTKGDKILDKPLSEIGGKNIFIAEIEQALLNGDIDIAIHSLKDMPAELDNRLMLACYPEREDARDVLISRLGLDFSELPEGSVLGSGSLRRQIQVKHNWPKVSFENIRGNVDTRIEKMKKRELAGVILAAAGIHRLGLNHLITRYITPEICVPPAGQGTLGIEVNKENQELIELLQAIDHIETRIVSFAERSALADLGGDCHLPVGIYGTIKDEKLLLLGFLARDCGEPYIEERISTDIGIAAYRNGLISRGELELESVEAGRKLAKIILANGGSQILGI